jgi:hypothetical protein
MRENSILSCSTTLQAAKKLRFVSGHDFSRAENDRKYGRALAPEGCFKGSHADSKASEGTGVIFPRQEKKENTWNPSSI